jgi:hypothetical protein
MCTCVCVRRHVSRPRTWRALHGAAVSARSTTRCAGHCASFTPVGSPGRCWRRWRWLCELP